MEIVDAHHHLWNPISNQPDVGYVWLRALGVPKPFGDPTPIQRDYLLEEFRLEPRTSEIVASVHVQADGALAEPERETAFIQSLSEQSGLPIAIVAFVDLSSSDAEAVIHQHQQHPNLRGIRQILARLESSPKLSFAPQNYLANKTWRRNFALLSSHQLSFDLQLYPEQMVEAAAFLSDFPDLELIVDHAGSPYEQSAAGLQRWRSALQKLARLPNCSIKLSGFGMYASRWSRANIKALVEPINAMFGVERVLFGSNYPVEKLSQPYQYLLDEIASFYPEAQQRAAVFADNARRCYRLP